MAPNPSPTSYFFRIKKLTDPQFYRVAYHHLKVRLCGSQIYEKEWKSHDIRIQLKKDGDWNNKESDWLRGYWDSVNHPHRALLIDHVLKYSLESALEIGCNCGPNLRVLADRSPGIRLAGIDINKEAIKNGNIWLHNEGYHNAMLFEGQADDLSQFPDNSFDVVFADAVLIYIGPDKIRSVIQEMIRVARKGVVLMEWHDGETNQGSGTFVFGRGLWKRNYRALIGEYASETTIEIEHISPEIWPDAGWSEYGAVISIKKEKA